MFQPQDVSHYRAIKAPAALKSRILDAASKPQQSHRILPAVIGFVACLILVVGISANSLLHPAVNIEVTTLTASEQLSSLVSPARIQAPYFTTITISGSDKLCIETEDTGLFILTDGASIPLEHSYTAQKHVTLHWYVEKTDVTLTINGKQHTLHADVENASVTVK